MLTAVAMRRIACLLLLTFTSLTLQPLQAAIHSTGNPSSTQAAPSADRQYGEGLSDLQETLERAEDKAERREHIDDDVAQMLARGWALDALEADVDASFAATEQYLLDQHLPAEILDRHRHAVQEVKGRQRELKRLLKDLEDADRAKDETGRRSKVRVLTEFMREHQKRKLHTPVDPDKLPFRTPKPTVRSPQETAERLRAALVKSEPSGAPGPASVGTRSSTVSPAPTPEDLAETEVVQITQAIQTLADSLDKSPVKIFNWVHNNIEFLPTYGSTQGAELTLTTRRGNAFDTASLLIALLRASNIPARYVYGTVEVPIDRTMNWLGGVTKPETAFDLFAQGGIPASGVVSGGAYTAVRLEHVWVEAWVDYEPSRGAVNRAGDTWIPLNAAFKQHQIRPGMDIKSAVPFDAAGFVHQLTDSAQLNEAEGWMSGVDAALVQSTLASYRSQVRVFLDSLQPEATLDNVLGARTIIPQEAPMLAGALPYQVVATGGRYAALPSTLRHAVTLKLYASALDRALDSPALSYATSLPALGSRRLSVTYVPASAADAQLIQSYQEQGASALPLYLIRVKPLIQVDGVTVASGSTVGMGQPQLWDVVLTDPQGFSSSPTAFSATAGDEMVFGVNGNGITPEVVLDRYAQVPPGTAAENLHQVALHYWMEHDLFDDLAARAHGVHVQRLPSVGLFASPLTVRYLFDIPRSGYYQGRQMDVKRVVLAAVADSAQARLAFMSQAGMQGSYFEGSVFDQLFSRPQGKSISAAQLLMDANQQAIPIYRINQANLDAVLPQLAVSTAVRTDIINAVQAGRIALVPQRELTHGTWSGSGYILQDPQSGAAAYLIEGGANGGLEGECGTQLSPQAAQQISLIAAAILTAMLQGPLSGAGGAAVAAYLSYFVVAGAGSAAATAAAIIAPLVIAVVLVTVLLLVAMLIHLALLEMSLVAASDAPDCECIPEPKPRECECKIEPACPHLGGDPIHDTCADTVPPNDFPGCDVLVTPPGRLGKRFDAMSGTVVWEFKTLRFALYPPFLKDRTLKEDLQEGRIERSIAHQCGLSFHYAVADPEHYTALVTSGFLFVPDKLIQTPGCLVP